MAAGPSKPPAPFDLKLDDEDDVLANAEVLTRVELMKRRAARLRQQAKFYKLCYWSLMEDLRRKHREYIWKFGSPFESDDEAEEEEGEDVFMAEDDVNRDRNGQSNENRRHRSGNGNGNELGLGLRLRLGKRVKECVIAACVMKAMPCTEFCHTHILYDPKQTLYKRCKFRLDKLSTESGAIQCSKPILRSAVPSMCAAHVQKTEKAIKTALRKSGTSATSSAKLASKFHCVISECVRMIQDSRRAALAEATKGDNCKMQH